MHAPLTAHELLADLIDKHPSAARVLLARRMHCVGCAVAAFETLGEACAVYGLSVDDVLDDLTAVVEKEENR